MICFFVCMCVLFWGGNVANSHGGPRITFSGMIGSLALKALKPDIELCVAFKWQQLRCYLPIIFLLFTDFSLCLFLIFQILYTVQNPFRIVEQLSQDKPSPDK